MVDSIKTSALRGMQQGFENAAKDAQKINAAFSTENPNDNADPVEPMIALKLDQQQVKASAKVLKTADEMDKSVLDILA